MATASLAFCTSDRPKTSFDGAAALGYVKTQLAFGPRIPNSIGAQRTGGAMAVVHHGSGPSLMGARTALPHSVQLPS